MLILFKHITIKLTNGKLIHIMTFKNLKFCALSLEMKVTGLNCVLCTVSDEHQFQIGVHNTHFRLKLFYTSCNIFCVQYRILIDCFLRFALLSVRDHGQSKQCSPLSSFPALSLINLSCHQSSIALVSCHQGVLPVCRCRGSGP